MTQAEFQELLSPTGQQALADADALRGTPLLKSLTRLRQRYPPTLARSAVDTAQLRRKARGKFSRAEQMYFTREALEQSSGEIITIHRARRFVDFATVGDFGCGIGGDTIGLARTANVVAIDRDEVRLAMAAANVGVYGLAERISFLQRDLQDMTPTDIDAFFFDPSRRSDGKRHLSVRKYQPPLEIVNVWRERIPAAGVKIAPGVDLSELEMFDAEIEFLSVGGELKECVLWFGPLRTTQRRATVLPENATLIGDMNVESTSSAPQQYLYEPNPAVIRAGLVGVLADTIRAKQIDPTISYLTSDQLSETPFARAWLIDDAFPFHLKSLRQWLRTRHVGNIIVKKRGSPIKPEQLIQQLKLSGQESRTLFLTRVMGKPFVIIAREKGDRHN